MSPGVECPASDRPGRGVLKIAGIRRFYISGYSVVFVLARPLFCRVNTKTAIEFPTGALGEIHLPNVFTGTARTAISRLGEFK